MMKLADYLLENPLYGYGRQVSALGAQTGPVLSPMEGLARALQGGVGGFFEGQGIRQAQQERTDDQKALASAMEKYATDPVGARQILASRPNLSDQAAALMMQDAGLQKQKDLLAYQQELETKGMLADRAAWGLPTAGGTSAGSGMVAGTAPNPNNIGNVRPVGQSVGFQQPPDFSSGVKLAVGNVQAYPGAFNNGQPMTLQQIGAKWAPAGDGKNDPMQWARNVASISGLPVDQPLDLSNPQIQAAFARGVHGAEWGANAVRPVNDYASAIAGTQGRAPQQALNVPNGGETITVAGIDVPRAALEGVASIRDKKERDKAFNALIQDSLKVQREGVPVERVRNQNGDEIIVPKANAVGMTSYATQPNAGGKEGDVALLTQAIKNPAILQDPATWATVKAAHDRLSQPEMSQSGQLKYPDMSAWAPLGFAAPQTAFKDTPSGQFQMSNTLANEFNALEPVKKYRVVEPLLKTMTVAAGKNNRVADQNMIYAMATIFDPGSVVRDGERIAIERGQALPDWLKGQISAFNGGSGLTPQYKQQMLDEAGSRFAALKEQHDQLAGQFNEKAKRYGLNSADVTGGLPPSSQQQGASAPASVPVFDMNAKRIK